MVEHFRLKAIDEDTEIALDKDTLVVGRDPACDAVIDHEDVSRRHARFNVSGDRITVQDLESTNGTSVNNRKVFKETAIHPGDVVKLGTKAFYLLAPRAADATVLAYNLADAVSESKESFIEDAFPQGDKTVFHQKFPMPPGWSPPEKGDESGASAKNDRDDKHVDRLLGKQLLADSRISAALVVVSGNHESQVMPLSITGDHRTWVIGKDSNADLRFTDVTISFHHAELTCDSGTWRIEDKDSTNGIKVNGAKKQSSFLRDRDKISLGGVSVVFCLHRRS